MDRKKDIEIVRVDRANAEQYLALVKALADYEHLDPPGDEARARLVRDATSDPPRFEAYLALLGPDPIGYITFYYTYSTFLAKPTLFLEDLFVLEEHRQRGFGKQLFQFCVREAARNGCGRMEWSALDWNAPAHRFYESLGGRKLPWYLFRLVEEDFDAASGPR